MELTFNAAFPVLARVTGCAVAAVFKGSLGNVRLAGVRLATGAARVAPMPVRLMVCGLFRTLSLTVRVPLRVPEIVGVNVTLMEQLALAPNVVGQLLTCA